MLCFSIFNSAFFYQKCRVFELFLVLIFILLLQLQIANVLNQMWCYNKACKWCDLVRIWKFAKDCFVVCLHTILMAKWVDHEMLICDAEHMYIVVILVILLLYQKVFLKTSYQVILSHYFSWKWRNRLGIVDITAYYPEKAEKLWACFNFDM